MLRGNLSHVWEWKYDADSKNMMTDLASDGHKLKTKIGRGVRLYVRWFHQPSADFYRKVWKEEEWLAPIHRSDTLEPLDDYFYFSAADTAMIADVPHVLIRHYPVSHSCLFRRTEFYDSATGGFVKADMP
jgi:hypothetical protein